MKTFLLVASLLGIVHGIIFLHKIDTVSNQSVMNVTGVFKNEESAGPKVNLTVHNFGTVNSAIVYLSVRIPESLQDVSFQREVLRTTTDVDRFLKGLTGNFLATFLLRQNILDFFDFPPKFPLEKVNSTCIPAHISLLLHISGRASDHQFPSEGLIPATVHRLKSSCELSVPGKGCRKERKNFSVFSRNSCRSQALK